MTLIYFLILLSLIIVIHEAGHLCAAKLFGVYCYEFSFGMGPVLLQKAGKETKYSIRAIPVGGFVSMAGEEDGDELYDDVEVPDERRLTFKPWWQKIIIMLAGVFMNFVLAYLIFTFVYLSIGFIRVSPEPIVDSVMAGSAAEKAGFMAGDRVLKIVSEDGRSIEPESYLDMQTFNASDNGTKTYYVLRGEETIEISVTPEYNEEEGRYLIGITAPEQAAVEVNWKNCWYYGFYEMKEIVRLMGSVIIGLISGHGLNQLSGPVGIYQATETYASMGLASFLFLVAQISLNVGLFNLLPLPVLDGGQVVLTLCEAVTRRKLNEKIKTGIMAVCWVLLIGIMLFATWNDIARIFGL